MDLQELKDTFEFLDDWEDKYRFIIDIGKELDSIDAVYKTDENLVRGCQSQVWLVVEPDTEGKLKLRMDSDAHIVRGLIAIVLAALNGRSAQDILDFDMNQLFGELELLQHLSPSRGNGLMSMLERIRAIASASV